MNVVRRMACRDANRGSNCSPHPGPNATWAVRVDKLTELWFNSVMENIKFNSKTGFYGVTDEGHDIAARDMVAGMEIWISGIAKWCDISTVTGIKYGKVRYAINGGRTGMMSRPDSTIRVR